MHSSPDPNREANAIAVKSRVSSVPYRLYPCPQTSQSDSVVNIWSSIDVRKRANNCVTARHGVVLQAPDGHLPHCAYP